MDAIGNKSNAPTNYAEYLLTPDDERWEIIEGVPYLMTPAPLTEHQRILGRLFATFYNYLEDKECEVFMAPFDVRILASSGAKDERINTVVQPDIVVVCDEDKIDRRGCIGAPDLVIEVLSGATAKRDKEDKMRLYRRAKVKEYWIVDPLHNYIEVILFEDNGSNLPERAFYSAADNDKIKVSIFKDLEINLAKIFA